MTDPTLLDLLNAKTCPMCGSPTEHVRTAPRAVRAQLEAQGVDDLRRCTSAKCPWWCGYVHGIFVVRMTNSLTRMVGG